MALGPFFMDRISGSVNMSDGKMSLSLFQIGWVRLWGWIQ